MDMRIFKSMLSELLWPVDVAFNVYAKGDRQFVLDIDISVGSLRTCCRNLKIDLSDDEDPPVALGHWYHRNTGELVIHWPGEKYRVVYEKPYGKMVYENLLPLYSRLGKSR